MKTGKICMEDYKCEIITDALDDQITWLFQYTTQ